MQIIVNPQRISRRTAATFTHGLGLAPATKEQALAKAQEVLLLILKIQPDVRTYYTQLKAVDPWWAENFNNRLQDFYDFRTSIENLSEGVPAVNEAFNTLVSMENAYLALQSTLANIKNPPAGGSSPPPPNTDKNPPPPWAPPADKKPNYFLWAGIGLAVAAVFLLSSEDKA